MGVSYRGERMIGNMPFSLFNGHKGREVKEKFIKLRVRLFEIILINNHFFHLKNNFYIFR